jgi:hypothetical protein
MLPSSLLLGLLPAALCIAAAAAQAQAAVQPARPDPLDAQAKVPALAYESSLATYRRSSNDKPLSWREANDNVARIGGWRVYAREAQQPAAAPMPQGHDGHRMP